MAAQALIMFLMFLQPCLAPCIPAPDSFSPQGFIRLQAGNMLQCPCVRAT